jgi:hypothetical protein
VEYEPVERVWERVQYLPVETQIVHYPETEKYVAGQGSRYIQAQGVSEVKASYPANTTYVSGGPGVSSSSYNYVSGGSGVGQGSSSYNVNGGSGVGQTTYVNQPGSYTYKSGYVPQGTTTYTTTEYVNQPATTTYQTTEHVNQPATTTYQTTEYVNQPATTTYQTTEYANQPGYTQSTYVQQQPTTYVSSGSGARYESRPI